MSRNPATCPHNIREQDPDTGEIYCGECGDVLDMPPDVDMHDILEIDNAHQ